jgi:hypothetical protein
MVGAACMGALATAVGGGVWAGHVTAPEQGARPAATRVVRAGVATLVVPREWRTVSLRGTGLADVQAGRTAVLAPSPGSSDRVIVTVAPAEDGSLVPQALRGLVPELGRGPRVTRLAGHRAWLYAALPGRNSDGAIDVTVLPSAAGVLGVACFSPGSSSSAVADCASSIGSVSMGGATMFVPSQDLALRLRLPRVLATLDRARVHARDGLRRADTPSGQARLARGVAREHLAAADSLRPVAGGAGASLVDQLSVAARAYLALGRAANGRSASRFGAARQGVESAEARLAEAVDRVVTRGTRQPAVAQTTRSESRLPATPGIDAPTILLLILVLPGVLAVGLGVLQIRGRLGSAPSRIGRPRRDRIDHSKPAGPAPASSAPLLGNSHLGPRSGAPQPARPAPAGAGAPSPRPALRVERPTIDPFVRWDAPPTPPPRPSSTSSAHA